jgi:hypothetical protein
MARRLGKGLLVTAALWVSLALAGTAQATLIDFEDGTSGNPVGSFYAGLGVEFSNAEWQNQTLPGMSGVMGIRAIGTYQWQQNNALVITFPGGVGNVRILGADVGGNGLRMDAFDAEVGGSLLDYDEVYGSDAGVDEFFTVETEGQLIYRVELYQVLNTFGDGIVLDDLEFNFKAPTPVPTLSAFSLALLALMIAGLGIVGFRRFQ